jgi:hypothetical protein
MLSGLYLSPPDKAVVVCIDTKTQVQALDRTAPILPMRPGLLVVLALDFGGVRGVYWVDPVAP